MCLDRIIEFLERQAYKKGSNKSITVVFKEGGVFDVLDMQGKELMGIEWGDLTPGEVATRPAVIRNNDTEKIVKIELTTKNWTWSPEGAMNPSGKITVRWGMGNLSPIEPGESREGLFILTVASNITSVRVFSFDVVINVTMESVMAWRRAMRRRQRGKK